MSGIAYAVPKIKKTDRGLEMVEVKTYYQNRVIWGDVYTDHTAYKGEFNTKVTAFGDGWKYSTTTDDTGEFKVEVKPALPFKIEVSDGNIWATSEENAGIQEGTTFDDRSK